jgi:hypothetical protein
MLARFELRSEKTVESFYVVLWKNSDGNLNALDKNGNNVLMIEDAKFYHDPDKARTAAEKFEREIDPQLRFGNFEVGLVNMAFSWDVKDRFV